MTRSIEDLHREMHELNRKIAPTSSARSLNWALQMFEAGPPSKQSRHREEAAALIRQATGLPLQDGLVLLQKYRALGREWEVAVSDEIERMQMDPAIRVAAHAYAKRYVMLPSEAAEHVRTALSPEERDRWFFGFWTPPVENAGAVMKARSMPNAPTWEETSEAITMFLMALEPVLANHCSDPEGLGLVARPAMIEIARGLRKRFKERIALMILHDLEQEGISVTFTTEELNRWLEEE